MKRLVGALIIVALSVMAGRYAYLELSRLSVFSLSNVEITCPPYLDKADILKTTELKIGESIFYQDLSKATDHLIGMPGVQAVKISRRMPSSVEIELQEDEVVLFVKTGGIRGLTRSQKVVAIDDLQKVLPIITGLETKRNRLTIADRLRLCYALDIFERLTSLSENLAGRLSEIHFCANGQVELFFDPGGVKVLLALRNRHRGLLRLALLDDNGILGNSGFFDMTGGRMVVKGGV